MAQAPTMNPQISQCPSPERCAGDGCTTGINTWPLNPARQRGVYCRLCSSCLLMSYRSLYCCCCFLLLGSSSPSRHDDMDLLISPAAPTVTCLVCHEAVAHLSCLQHSASDVFVCPACDAATEGRPFSYTPPCNAPFDERGSRVLLLAARMSLALLRKYAAEKKALAEQMAAKAVEKRKRAYRRLGLALGMATKLPSSNEDITPPENMGPECSVASMRIVLDLNEPAPPPSPAPLMIRRDVCAEMATAHADTLPRLLAMPETGIEGVCRAPPPSPATLTIGEEDVCTEMAIACPEPPEPLSMATPTTGMEGVCTEVAMASAEPPLLSMARDGTGMEGVSREMAMAPAEGPLRRTLQLFWKDEEEDG